ncbi:MAG: hypothetical protein QOF76_3463 [Solirubrobacteraceae bacterium]|jgi:hypothetical protein|nr:hypothetical protein [Solirubrobacteraceae bacterium]
MPPVGTLLAGGRVGLGALTLLAPEVGAKAFGLGLDGQAGTFARLFATREIMLGSAVLFGGPGARAFALKSGIGVDAGDALGAILENRAGRLPTAKSALLAGVALGAVGAGVMALSE